tara:strand:+ start:180 stop:488 length:309 start_codon:yes stop_codon:yes gene_type:complete
MEAEGIAGILAGISGLVTGGLGGIKWVKNQQVEELKTLFVSYSDAVEFNRKEVTHIKVSLDETRQMHKECEEGRNALECQIDELRDKTLKMETIIQKHIRIN